MSASSSPAIGLLRGPVRHTAGLSGPILGKECTIISHDIKAFSVYAQCQSGHSKWSKIRHDKGKKDANKANAFSKISERITEFTKHWNEMAHYAETGYGPDPRTNPQLKVILDHAKKSGMSGTSMENAVKRGQGLSISGKPLETILIEGMLEGVSFIVTLQDVRLIMGKGGAKQSSTLFQFTKHPFMYVTGPEGELPEAQLAKLEDPALMLPIDRVTLLSSEDDVPTWELKVEHSDPPLQIVEDMQRALPEGWSVTKTGMKYYPTSIIELEDDSEGGENFRNLVAKLEENGDVCEIHSNLRWSSYEPPAHELILSDSE
ncbi:hypothetical protein Dda_0863 [Drechslerella dactyloides]|uniref:Uncharacterized protein n=1 Tax=Drechslerella dactyloides TaxID=74499 RepID=A0AAD6NPC5_DREDA|nr:hypothetical protein Dda_0863 [Drechslerella dactyloides]